MKEWGEEVLLGIEEVSIDMWRPYQKVAEEMMPEAEVVVDRFHVMKQINEELDKARRSAKREMELRIKKTKRRNRN